LAMGGGRRVQVKNRAPAPIQITAEQILREAKERELEGVGGFKAPRQVITDPAELQEYRISKRKEFEDRIRMQRAHIGNWVKYAQWEESQKEFQRARSIYLRAMDVDYQSVTLWLKYAEMEMRNKFINHARNVWDRAVALLPRVDQLWYKYAYMEEIVGNIVGARQVFDRWMQWEPDDQAWYTYIKFEERAGETARARALYEQYVQVNQGLKGYLKWAKWESRNGQRALSRQVYEKALVELVAEEQDERLFLNFAEFEEICHEYERARQIFQYGLKFLPKTACEELHKKYVMFEKKHGSRKGIEDVIIGKRRFQYEEKLKADPLDYDTWFDYCHLEEQEGDSDRTRDVYERAIANIPPVAEKRVWKRYIYLWINYALYEELEEENVEQTRQVYQQCLKVIPHTIFTFSKIWIMFAHFEIRQKNIDAARKVLGISLGKCPKEKLFKEYIQLELQLGEVDRCRKIYAKFLEWAPHHCYAWSKYAELEQNVGELDRCRALYELAVNQPLLDMPEVLWKAYIDFEVDNDEHDKTRILFERLLERTRHVKVYMSFAKFEWGITEYDNARDILDRAARYLKTENLREERAMLYEHWKGMEVGLGEEENADKIQEVVEKMPKKVKKKKMIQSEDGGVEGYEEYFDYIFPDDEYNKPSLKILELAHKWKMENKKRKMEEGGDDDEQEPQEPEDPPEDEDQIDID
jgi:crooked neck